MGRNTHYSLCVWCRGNQHNKLILSVGICFRIANVSHQGVWERKRLVSAHFYASAHTQTGKGNAPQGKGNATHEKSMRVNAAPGGYFVWSARSEWAEWAKTISFFNFFDAHGLPFALNKEDGNNVSPI